MTEGFVSKLIELSLNNVAAFLLGCSVVLYMVYVKYRLDDKLDDALKMLRNVNEFIEQAKSSRQKK